MECDGADEKKTWKESDLRAFLEKHVHRTYTPPDEIFQTILNTVLTHHDTWKHRLQDISGIKITRSRINKGLLLKLKTSRSWFTTSWKKCVTREQRNYNYVVKTETENRLESSMRTAIRRQICAWKRINMMGRTCAQCQKSGVRLQVDHHTIPFAELRKTFLSECEVSEVPSEFGWQGGRGQSKFLPSSKGFCRKWQRYHAKHATYQWLCGTCNRQKGCRVPEK